MLIKRVITPLVNVFSANNLHNCPLCGLKLRWNTARCQNYVDYAGGRRELTVKLLLKYCDNCGTLRYK